MEIKKVLWKRYYKAGFTLTKEVWDGSNHGDWDVALVVARTPNGDYIGNSKIAWGLCIKRGIKPEKADPSHNVCSIGFSEREQKWYGWSHRAIFGFKIGDVVKEGDCAASSGWIEEYLREHPEQNKALPVGFTACNLDDAKRMAIAFADSVG